MEYTSGKSYADIMHQLMPVNPTQRGMLRRLLTMQSIITMIKNKENSSGNFTPGSAACIDAAVTPAIPAGASYHRTQASPLLAHCCCHSSAPPELLPTAPTTQTTAQTAQQQTHIHAHAQTEQEPTQGKETQNRKEKIMREK